MRSLRWYEFAAGWLAVLIGAAVAWYTWQGGFIAPDSVQKDLIWAAVMLGLIALSVTLEVFMSSLLARILLTVAALAWCVVVTSSFLTFLLPSGGLALLATTLAFMRQTKALKPRRLGA